VVPELAYERVGKEVLMQKDQPDPKAGLVGLFNARSTMVHVMD
jgi:hypothetical protein